MDQSFQVINKTRGLSLAVSSHSAPVEAALLRTTHRVVFHVKHYAVSVGGSACASLALAGVGSPPLLALSARKRFAKVAAGGLPTPASARTLIDDVRSSALW